MRLQTEFEFIGMFTYTPAVDNYYTTFKVYDITAWRQRALGPDTLSTTSIGQVMERFVPSSNVSWNVKRYSARGSIPGAARMTACKGLTPSSSRGMCHGSATFRSQLHWWLRGWQALSSDGEGRQGEKRRGTSHVTDRKGDWISHENDPTATGFHRPSHFSAANLHWFPGSFLAWGWALCATWAHLLTLHHLPDLRAGLSRPGTGPRLSVQLFLFYYESSCPT